MERHSSTQILSLFLLFNKNAEFRSSLSRCRTLFDYTGVEGRLAEILNVRVDLAPEDMLHELVQTEAEREAVIVF